MAKVLVTGGAGFIGSHVVDGLLARGHTVRVLDNLTTGHRNNLVAVSGSIEFVEGDLRSEEACERACRGVEFVFHQAACVSVPRSVADPMGSHAVNVRGTLNLLRAAHKADCRRVVYASSSSAYGNTPESPKRESMRPRPLSPYAVQKLTGEMYCAAFFECYGLETVALRYFNVFGPRQDPLSPYSAAIPAFVRAAWSGNAAVVYGDGEQTRDFTFVENVVDANLLAMEASGVRGQCLNIACGRGISVNEVLAAIRRVMGRPLEARYEPARKGDVLHSRADIGEAKRLLGYEPRVDFDTGLKKAVEFYTTLFAK